MAFPTRQSEATEEDTNVDAHTATPVRYVSLDEVYSATTPCLSARGSSGLTSKKIKARKLPSVTDQAEGPEVDEMDRGDDPLYNGDSKGDDGGARAFRRRPRVGNVPLVHVYSRRTKRPVCGADRPSLFDILIARAEAALGLPIKAEFGEDMEMGEGMDEGINCSKSEAEVTPRKKRKCRGGELAKLGVSSSDLHDMSGPRLRENRRPNGNTYCDRRKRRKRDSSVRDNIRGLPTKKRWVRLSYDDADPKIFVGLQCKVFWPLDADWYTGSILGYDPDTNKHNVKYEDGDKEDIALANEKIKFYLSPNEMQQMNLKYSIKSMDSDACDYEEMVVLAASLDDCQEPEPGDIVWAKLTGHAMWPGLVVDDSHISAQGISNKASVGRSVSVQFFGTHDFARIKTKQIISFLRGLLSSLHLKCKKPRFVRALEEAKTYLSEQRLPRRMLLLQSGRTTDDCVSASDEDGESGDSAEDCMGNENSQRKLEGLGTLPYVLGDLQVISLGKIVRDSEFFQDGKYIWPEGYTAMRQFTSIKDPRARASYKMEVLRDPELKTRPLFRVSLDSGEQFKGSTPSACWDKIYKRLKKAYSGMADGVIAEAGVETTFKHGSHMFGFSNPKVAKLIQCLSKSRHLTKVSMSKFPVGYRPVRVEWKDLDKCSVCHMDEEYANNLFLQCDKCRMMVHAKCYGELEPVDGVLWLCNLCRPGAPDPLPPCCLCPVIGGAMKPTTDGRWAHLACAMWIPETCLSDVKRMEPIDGISRINKDRWKLLCSICGVQYGACIQCSNNTCRVAYHPLCARAAGLCVELEDEERLHLLSIDDEDEEHCIRLLSFCKKHRQPSNERPGLDEHVNQIERQCSNYDPPSNPSGCARCEPYSSFGRRGRKEPEALAAASLKRLFVENQPYLVGGYSQHLLAGLPSNGVAVNKYSSRLHQLRFHQVDTSDSVSSMAEKYKFMRQTFRKRLAFGKSGIHGFGIFTKQPHRAGDMVIEYSGELVRPPIADRREHFIYNKLVGAGTYMFRIDDERVIDATRAGSIAHLINHSCEPNCYSRVISVNGDEHIIIFAKRDIERWEELTYDYRFFSIDEQLACYCGFPGCRGVVNDTEAEEQAAKLYVPRSDLVEWKGD